jgi:hypothetical protein
MIKFIASFRFRSLIRFYSILNVLNYRSYSDPPSSDLLTGDPS